MTTIRAMTAADAPAVAALLSASWARTYSPILGAAKVDAISAARHTPEILAAEAAEPANVALVCEAADGLIAGYALAWPDEKGDAWLERLHVRPDNFGSGLAARMLDGVAAAFPGARAIALDVIVGNDRAIAFYRKHGFVTVDPAVTYAGLDHAPAVVMRKDLGA